MKGAFFIIAGFLLVSGCLAPGDSRLMDSYEKARVRDIIEMSIKRIPTYQQGGSSLRQISMFSTSCVGGSNLCWDASYGFVSEFDGYGFRENLIRNETRHTIKVKLSNDTVIYSVIDDRWDTLIQTEI